VSRIASAQFQAMPDDELRDVRRDLETSIGLMRRESPMYATATVYLTAVTAELDRRTRPLPTPLTEGHSPEPDDPDLP
jgi:hypothetical protein